MMSPQEFSVAWGKGLYRLPPALLADLNVPKASKQFLSRAGLPIQAEVPLGMYVVPLPVIPASPPVQAAKYPLMASYPTPQIRLLAYLHYDEYWGNDLYYGIEEETGHIRQVGPREGLGRLVNTSIGQFAEFLLSYRKFVNHFRPQEPERSKIAPLIISLAQEWHAIDKEAMLQPEHYWSAMLYDLEAQL